MDSLPELPELPGQIGPHQSSNNRTTSSNSDPINPINATTGGFNQSYPLFDREGDAIPLSLSPCQRLSVTAMARFYELPAYSYACQLSYSVNARSQLAAEMEKFLKTKEARPDVILRHDSVARIYNMWWHHLLGTTLVKRKNMQNSQNSRNTQREQDGQNAQNGQDDQSVQDHQSNQDHQSTQDFQNSRNAQSSRNVQNNQGRQDDQHDQNQDMQGGHRSIFTSEPAYGVRGYYRDSRSRMNVKNNQMVYEVIVLPDGSTRLEPRGDPRLNPHCDQSAFSGQAGKCSGYCAVSTAAGTVIGDEGEISGQGHSETGAGTQVYYIWNPGEPTEIDSLQLLEIDGVTPELVKKIREDLAAAKYPFVYGEGSRIDAILDSSIALDD